MVEKQELFKILDAIEQVVLTYTPGWNNQEARNTIQAYTQKLKYHLEKYGHAVEKIQSIIHWSEILYSQRRHEKHGGIENVKVFLLSDCQSVKDIVLRINGNDT